MYIIHTSTKREHIHSCSQCINTHIINTQIFKYRYMYIYHISESPIISCDVKVSYNPSFAFFFNSSSLTLTSLTSAAKHRMMNDFLQPLANGFGIPTSVHKVEPKPLSKKTPTYPWSIPQESLNPQMKGIPSQTVGWGSGVCSRGMLKNS